MEEVAARKARAVVINLFMVCLLQKMDWCGF